MKTENSYVGQIDLLALLGAELREIDSKECIVIPLEANPTIEVKEKKNGDLKAQMDIFLKEIDGRYGNTHFIKAVVSKLSLERMSMTYIEARQFTPILGNIKPFVHEEVTPSPKETVESRERRERLPSYDKSKFRKRNY